MRTLFGVLAALAVLGASPVHASWPPWYQAKRVTPSYPEILVSAKWLAAHRRDRGLTVVDARPPSRYERAHVAGAVAFDAASAGLDPSTLGPRLGAAGISSEGVVVCYGDSDDPGASGRMLWLLELAGHRQARVLNGGFEAWKARDGKTESGATRPRPARFGAAPDTSRIADYGYVTRVMGTPGHTLVDWRTPAQWEKGHVPHSLPFHLEKLAVPGGAWLEPPAMRLVFEDFGPRDRDYVDLTDEFVVFGDAPPSAVPIHPYLAARAVGIGRVRCYPEGFAGWKEHADAPVTRIVGADELRRNLGVSLWQRLRRIPPRQVMLFDLRGDREFEWGHIPGAVSLPSYNFERDLDSTVAALWPNVDRAKTPFVVYCYGVACIRSRNCTTIAARRGFKNLWWFREGLPGWQAAGLELAKGK
jgi:3-mercaptopyruvate sulfurtransferase SseA